MAKILYAVHGTGHGHAVRALTIARRFREHEFLFVSHGTGAGMLRREYSVVDCPSLITVVKQHRVAPVATAVANLRILGQRPRIIRRLLGLMDRWQPDAVMSDYELFLAQACRRLGVPCLNLDHQHIITSCRHQVPASQKHSYVLTSLIVQHLYSYASDFLVTSFFRPPLKPGLRRTRLAPPLLREMVLDYQPREGEHVVAYQGYSTFHRFFPFLSAIPRPVFVYGFDQDRQDGNLRFKKHSESGFLADLAACCYVVCGGSHSLLSEALYYGKPVFSFPIKDAFEQFLNAFYLEKMGIGAYFTGFQPEPTLIPAFEAQLPHFRQNISQHRFNGNPEIFALAEHFIQQGRLPEN